MPIPRVARLGSALALGATAAMALAAPAMAGHRPDPLVAEQWALEPAAIGAPQAWERSTGQGVVVAVLDTGVQVDHPDLQANLWRNPGEVAGNGVDDDGNGIVDDVHGTNVLAGSGDPSDDQGHGTHVAGTIAAARNHVGVAGLAPDARIMAVKVLDHTNAGTWADLATGIRYAVAEGARIINVSINGEDSSRAVSDAIAEAARAGVLVVASAGNNGRDIDARPSYPAAMPHENLVVATASTEEGDHWGAGNTGATAVDLAAPGERILSTAFGSHHETRSGTSMAAPHVAGALALLAAARPDASASALRQTLLDTARRTPALSGRVAAGRLDVGAAIGGLTQGAMAREARLSPPRAPRTRRPRLRAGRRVRAGRVSLAWRGRTVAGVRRWRVSLDGRIVARVRARSKLRVRAHVRPGRHRWGVVGYDARGRKLTTASKRFRAVRRR